MEIAMSISQKKEARREKSNGFGGSERNSISVLDSLSAIFCTLVLSLLSSCGGTSGHSGVGGHGGGKGGHSGQSVCKSNPDK
jgi:hypothetical protein